MSDQGSSSLLMINSFFLSYKIKEKIRFFYLSLILHLRRGNQIEYIEMRKKREMDACRALAAAEMR
jgi:hypothetical protein